MKKGIIALIAGVLVCICVLIFLFGYGRKGPVEANPESDGATTSVGQPVIPSLAPEAAETPEPSPTPTPSLLTEEQQNSINMLNYLTVLVQEIHEAKNNRLYLESAYSELLNNTEPSIVDELTLDEYENILSTISRYRLAAIKRERLQYIFDQNSAHAIRSALPNPLAVLSAVQADNPLKSIVSLAYMAMNSYNSYSSYTDQLNLQFLQDGWVLDDEEAENLHNSRTNMFAYMVRVARDNELPAGYTLNEESVADFVKWVNDGNAASRIRWLKAHEETYARYGEYWLTLSDSYYETQNYEECLAALHKYEDLNIHIFRMDLRLARTLPNAIIAASETMSEKEYVAEASRLADLIIDNTKTKDWSLRYFAAQTYIDLYARTHSKDYLRQAFEIIYDNVNELVSEQKKLNVEYLAPLDKVPAPDDASREEKKAINEYNESLEEARKKGLPPVYEPLQLNCELLLAITNELNLSKDERKEIDLILHPMSDPVLFLDRVMDAKYTFSLDSTASTRDADAKYDINIFGKHEISLPARFMADGCKVVVTVTGNVSHTLADWTVQEVNRNKSEDVSDFVVTLNCTPDVKFSVEDNDRITVKVYLPGSEKQEHHEQDAVVFSFKVSKSTLSTSFERVT